MILIIFGLFYFIVQPNGSSKPKLLHTNLSSKSSILAQMVQLASTNANSLDSPMPINIAISNDGKVILVDQLTIGLVSQINTTNMQIVHTYQVPYSSLGITFARDDKSAYVVGTNGNIVQLNLINFTTTTIRQEQLHTTNDSYFLDVAASQDNQDLWISSPNNNQIIEYNFFTNKITKTFNLINAPFDIALTQNNKYLWMTEPESDQIQELNLSNGDIVDTIGFNSPVFGITLVNNDKTAWVTEPFKGDVIEENLANNGTLKTLSGFNKPAGISVNPSNHELAICLFGTNNVITLDPTTFKQLLSYNIDPQESTNTGYPGSTNNSNPYANNVFVNRRPNTIFFANELDGWEITLVNDSNFFGLPLDETIQMTTDGGKTWIPSYNGKYSALMGLDFINSQVGWALVNPVTSQTTTLEMINKVQLLETTNGGLIWTPIATTTDSAMLYINFTTAQDGLAIDSTGQLLQTTDGGYTWTLLTNTPTRIWSLCQTTSGTYIANPNNAYVEQSNGSWQSIFTNSYGTVQGGGITLYCDGNTVIATVPFIPNMDGDPRGLVEESLNGGKTWEVATQSFPAGIAISNNFTKIGFFTLCPQLVCPNGDISFYQLSFNSKVPQQTFTYGIMPNQNGATTTTTPQPNYYLSDYFFLESGYGWVQIRVIPSGSIPSYSNGLGDVITFVTTNFGLTWTQQ